jgi:sporulation-control protein spo0M
MDSAFKAAPYSGYTTDELRQMVSRPSAKAREMWAEIDRRERVAAGDVSVMTAAERLRYNAKREG